MFHFCYPRVEACFHYSGSQPATSPGRADSSINLGFSVITSLQHKNHGSISSAGTIDTTHTKLHERCIDGAIFGIVGQDVLQALYKHLEKQYDITHDEVPYRLDTVFETLEQTFGVKGARTLSRAIARRLYFRLNLQFVETQNYRLQDYMEQAKKELLLQKDLK
jgi:hypothetical protein